MSSSSSKRAGAIREEQWKNLRRKLATTASGDRHRGHAGPSSIGQGRDGQQASPPSGKFLPIPITLSFLRSPFCFRGGRIGTRNSKSHRRRRGNRDRSLDRKFEDSGREVAQKKLLEESEHPRYGPPHEPDSERALGQRIRKNLPPGGGNPKSIASGL
ncbi:unnamed protein product [Sphagnum troendelagicum]|uniref:Uncharacterized protein n=1 Tax=Sphagnum troendelagicum TaxID=128251 RepID=A0ABP0UHU6_9BRYO